MEHGEMKAQCYRSKSMIDCIQYICVGKCTWPCGCHRTTHTQVTSCNVITTAMHGVGNGGRDANANRQNKNYTVDNKDLPCSKAGPV